MSTLTITQSTIRTWDRCKRKWWLSDYRRLTRDEYRSPLNVGNLVHGALEQYYVGAYGDDQPEFVDPITWVKNRSLSVMEEYPDDAEYIAKDATLAGIMVEGYMEWLQETGADADVAHAEPERVIRTTLVPPSAEHQNGIVLLGKLDGKLKYHDGWVGFREDKTVGNFVDLPSIAQIDRQLLTYDLLEYLEYLENETQENPPAPLTDGAVLNMLRKVKRTAAAKPPFYLRQKVEHNIHELRNHWRHVVGIAREMERAIARLDAGESHHVVAPPTPQVDCRWSCPFYSICSMFDDGSDVEAVLELEYRDHDPLDRYELKEVVA